MKIGIMDSGIGGLTVLKSLLKKCQKHEYIYYGDTIHLPYGNKPKDEIASYANNIIKFFESRNVDIIIIACGTLSSNKELLKSKKRIIDIVSPIKGRLDNYNKVSILATPLSIKTNAFKNYIKTEINLIACPKLVSIIESANYGNLNDVLKEYLESAFDSDALVLGCTHYPIVKDNIRKFFKKDIICLDDFIVDMIEGLDNSKSSLKLYFSKVDDILIENVKKILARDNIIIERMCLND